MSFCEEKVANILSSQVKTGQQRGIEAATRGVV